MSLSSTYLIQLIATVYMLGLATFVMVVHYPMYRSMPNSWFKDYQKKHIKPTIPITFLPMLVELSSSLVFWYLAPSSLTTQISLVVLTVIWLQTFSIIVPGHLKLSDRDNSSLIRNIIVHHNIRTGLWATRVLLLIFIANDLKLFV